MRILIIEDEEPLALAISDYLKSEDYHCDVASDYRSALRRTADYRYDCIVLDLMLPGGDGLKILEELRKMHREDGVIIISARDSIGDKISGLKLGADDYLAKPFHLSELAARIFALIRRQKFGTVNVVRYNEITVDLDKREVAVNDDALLLTKKEFDLLIYFLANKHKLLTKEAIAEYLSGDMADAMGNFDFIYAHIKNLKRKLRMAGANNYLSTLYNSGYKWGE